jgi:ABC-type sugar transport system ATPase subunit
MSESRFDAFSEAVPPLLEVQNLKKEYGAIVALREVSFAVAAGEILGLVGDNGAGKSTLVNSLAGAVIPTGGRIILDGVDQEFRNPADAQAAGVQTVFQQLALIEIFDTASNFFLGRELVYSGWRGALRIIDKGKMRKQAEAALARLPARFLDTRAPIETMSGGQRQAVAMAKAAFWGGRLLLLDEPTAALGIRESAGVLEMITHLVSAGGMAMIIISHNIEHVWTVCSRILVLRQGRLVADLDRTSTTKEQVVGYITGAIGV